MANPNNALGTNGAYNGRTSVNAFNDVLSGFTNTQPGILGGWEASINDSQQLVIGGNNKIRDVAIAMDPNGNMTTLNNISGQPITLDLPTPPVTGTRYDMIVGYVTAPPNGSPTEQDNPAACGILVVDGGTNGSSASDADTTIRQAITQDGAAGTTAYYVVLCEVLRTSGQTVISPGNIIPGNNKGLDGKFPIKSEDIDWASITYGTSEKIIGSWVDGKPIYRKVINFGSLPNNTTKSINTGIANIDQVISLNARWYDSEDKGWWDCNNYYNAIANATYLIKFFLITSDPVAILKIQAEGLNWGGRTSRGYTTIEYTKTTD